MTQPVQEPTQGRQDQAQEFRTRQLFRRPSPAPSSGGSATEFAFYKAVGIDLEADPFVRQLVPFDFGNNAYYSDFPATFTQETDGIRILVSGVYRVDAMIANWPEGDPLDRFYSLPQPEFLGTSPAVTSQMLLSQYVGFISGSNEVYQSFDVIQLGESEFEETVVKLYVEISVDFQSFEGGQRTLMITRVGDLSEPVDGWTA